MPVCLNLYALKIEELCSPVAREALRASYSLGAVCAGDCAVCAGNCAVCAGNCAALLLGKPCEQSLVLVQCVLGVSLIKASCDISTLLIKAEDL